MEGAVVEVVYCSFDFGCDLRVQNPKLAFERAEFPFLRHRRAAERDGDRYRDAHRPSLRDPAAAEFAVTILGVLGQFLHDLRLARRLQVQDPELFANLFVPIRHFRLQ